MGDPSDSNFPPLEDDDEDEPTTQQTAPPGTNRATFDRLPTEVEESYPSFDQDDDDAPTIRSDPRVTANEKPPTRLERKGRLADDDVSDDTAVDEAVVSMPEEED